MDDGGEVLGVFSGQRVRKDVQVKHLLDVVGRLLKEIFVAF